MTQVETYRIGKDRIIVQTKPSTHLKNLCGYNVRVNECKYFFAVLTHTEAREKGYVKYIKENR